MINELYGFGKSLCKSRALLKRKLITIDIKPETLLSFPNDEKKGKTIRRNVPKHSRKAGAFLYESLLIKIMQEIYAFRESHL